MMLDQSVNLMDEMGIFLFLSGLLYLIFMIVLVWLYHFTLTTKVLGLTVTAGVYTGWVCFAVATLDLTFEDDLLLSIGSIGSIIIVYILSGIYLFRHVFNPLQSLTNVAVAMGSGEINVQPPIYRRSDEVGDLSSAFQHMLTFLNLSTLVRSVAESAEKLASTAEQLVSSSEEMNASSEEITSISQQISTGAVSQTNKVQTTTTKAQELKKELLARFRDIQQTADLIHSIASQVNMLSLNASIEAARAGEYGRGFAVVADNIRILSEDTSSSLRVVEDSITDLQSSVKGLDVLLKDMEEIASIAEENASGAEEASAATEQQSASMEELTSTAQELDLIARQLSELVEGYRG